MIGTTTSKKKPILLGLSKTCTWCGEEACVTLFRRGSLVRACVSCARYALKHGPYSRRPKE